MMLSHQDVKVPHIVTETEENAAIFADRDTLFLLRIQAMIQLKVNGRERKFAGDPEMPLLWFLRDELSLTGAKFGCGAGLCGACTVHQNGAAVRACITPMKRVAGKDITTIEGLGANGLHPVQKAWVKLEVPQCGYCQPGQIMQAAALLSKNAKPGEAEIEQAMSGNICRCGTYQRIKAAILEAVKENA